MAQKVSVFAKLQENFRRLYDHLKCQDCKRKIDLQTKCSSCEAVFCTECLFQIKKTTMCKSCKATDSMKQIKNRNQFVRDLLDLIQMFDNDTGLNIIKEEFLNVETADNLERIFDKEKLNVFNQQKFIATSTPNINNTKKVVFNSDITMIPQNAKEAASKQVESVEKATSNKKSTEKVASNSLSSKRKADSIEEKSDNSRSKKAKLVEAAPEVSKEIQVKEMEIDKKATDKQVNTEKSSKLVSKENNELNQEAKENSQPDDDEMDDQGYEEQARMFENMREQCEGNVKRLEEKCKELDNQLENLKAKDKQTQAEKAQLEAMNKQIQAEKEQLETKLTQIQREKEQLETQMKQILTEKQQLEVRNKQSEVDNKQLTDTIRKLEEKMKLLEAKKDLEDRAIQLINDQLKAQTNNVNHLVENAISAISKTMNLDRMQEMNIVSLARIVSNSENAIKSSIEFDEVGKINFIIEPFREVKKMKDFELQTDEFKKSTGQIYIQTEAARLASQSSNPDLNGGYFENEMPKSQCSVDSEVRRFVSNVIDKSLQNGKRPLVEDDEGNDVKPTNLTNGNKSNNHLSIRFDDDSMKETKDSAPNKGKSEEKVDSDELKKHVANDSIFEDSDDEIDEIGASSPIYE